MGSRKFSVYSDNILVASRVQADPEHCEGALNSDSKTSSKEDKLLISPAIDPLAFPRRVFKPSSILPRRQAQDRDHSVFPRTT